MSLVAGCLSEIESFLFLSLSSSDPGRSQSLCFCPSGGRPQMSTRSRLSEEDKDRRISQHLKSSLGKFWSRAAGFLPLPLAALRVLAGPQNPTSSKPGPPAPNPPAVLAGWGRSRGTPASGPEAMDFSVVFQRVMSYYQRGLLCVLAPCPV